MDKKNRLKSPFPNVTTHQAVTMVTRLFNLNITAVKELNSFDDKNFYMRGSLVTDQEGSVRSDCKEYILKIANYVNSNHECFIDTQLDAMTFLHARGYRCSSPVLSVFGTRYVLCKMPRSNHSGGIAFKTDEDNSNGDLVEIYDGGEYSEEENFVCAVRLLNFVPGKVLDQTSLSIKLLFDVGMAVGRMNRDLQEFGCSNLDRGPEFMWDMSCAGEEVEQFLEAVSENHRIEMVQEICQTFRKEISAKLPLLPKQFIHGDLNHGNILVFPSENGNLVHGVGFIDFGFLNYSCRVFDVAVALMHILNVAVDRELSCGRVRMAKYFLAGYHSVNPLSVEEIELLPILVATRFCQSLVYCTYLVSPDDEKELTRIRNCWRNLEVFWKLPKEEILNIWCQINNDD